MDKNDNGNTSNPGGAGNAGHQHGININVNLDTTPILYTDNVFISVNEAGIVLDFSQQLASTNQVRIVARIGMSREHAKKFEEQFEAMLKVAEGKAQTAEKKIKTN